jgi:hypothetical protein
MDRALRDALLLHDPAAAETRSWHSYRIRLASKLRAAVTPSGEPMYSDAVIQAFVRWKSPSSLNIYARYDTAKYAAILRSVQDVDISSVQYSNLPELSETDRLETLAEAAPLCLSEPSAPTVKAKRPQAPPQQASSATPAASIAAAPCASSSRSPPAPDPSLAGPSESAHDGGLLLLISATERCTEPSAPQRGADAFLLEFERPSKRRPPVPRIRS